MHISIFTLGCKTNYCDSEAMAACLIKAGHTVNLKLEIADVYIINTCSVTSYSDHKSRQAIAKAKKLNQKAKIYVAGCSVEADKSQFERDGITAICGTSGKQEFAERIILDLANFCHGDGGVSKIKSFGNTTVPMTKISTDFEEPKGFFKGRKRGFIKIQDGCNNFCAYCIVPYLRGQSRSRSIHSVLAEAVEKASIANEIVITGICISDYGKDLNPPTNLTYLIKRLGEVNAKKRLSSLSPLTINKEFLETCTASDIIPEFHIALQSGSDRMLKAMERRYTVAEFTDAIELIRRGGILPPEQQTVITADIICGFPGETEEDHIATRNLLKKLKLDAVHVFPFSVRAGTKAEKMDGKVDDKIIRRRAKEMREM